MRQFFKKTAGILFFSVVLNSMIYGQVNVQQNQQNNTVVVNSTPVVIEKPVYIERYRTVYVNKPQPKRVARKLPAPVKLLGYLWAFPEDIGNFKQQPFDVIKNINAQKMYGRDDWRIPTPDELAVLENNADKVGLGDDIYLATDHTNGVLRLVSTGKSIAEKITEQKARDAEENAKLKNGFVKPASQLGKADYDGTTGIITNTGGSNYQVRSMGGVWWLTQNADKVLSQGCTYTSINKGGFGNLYSFSCASQVCPAGWTLPTDEDFKNLSSWLTVNNKWQEWNSGNSLAGGANDGKYYFDQNAVGYWWSNSGNIYYVNTNGTILKVQTKQYNGVSYCVRCVKK